jgi:hypothetical protein
MLAIHLINIGQTASTPFRSRTTTTNLRLTQVARNNLIKSSVASRIPLTQTLTWSVDGERGITHTLPITQSLLKGSKVSTSTPLILQQFLSNRPPYQNQQLTITQNPTYTITKPNKNKITIVSFASYQRDPKVNQTIALNSSVTYYKLDPQFTALTTLFTSGSSSLSWGGLTVNLPSPEFGDTDSIELSRVVRRTQGNKLENIRKSYWPKTRRITMTYSWLKLEQITLLQYFLTFSVGQCVTYTSFRGETITGVISNPDTDIIQEKRQHFTITLNMEVPL